MKKRSMGFTSWIESVGTVTDSATVVSVSTDVPIGTGPDGILMTETITAYGVSKRDPNDKFNQETAIKLAYGRALDSLAKKMLRQGNGLVKCQDDNRAVNEKRAKLKLKAKSSKKNKKRVRELVASTS
jgi:hypothetical protein